MLASPGETIMTDYPTLVRSLFISHRRTFDCKPAIFLGFSASKVLFDRSYVFPAPHTFIFEYETATHSKLDSVRKIGRLSVDDSYVAIIGI